MSPPNLFNDPFDCLVNFEIEDPTKAEIEKIRLGYLSSDSNGRFKDAIRTFTDQDLINLHKTQLRKVLNAHIEESNKKIGICCFSEANTDLLMWGHYGEGFKGFCLEFKTEYEPFSKLYPVTYLNETPKLSGAIEGLSELEFHLKLYSIKSSHWAYEKEWRIIHQVQGTLYNYSLESLKAIYFGPKIDPDFREILCLILQGQNPHVELWQGNLSQNSFSMDFDKVQYTNHVKAKSLGLI